MASKTQVKTRKKPERKYEQIISKDDGKINVLILGTSGCGKSTLINALLEANEAPTGVGEAVTKEIAIYQNDVLPFRMIDSVGYEYGLFSQTRIKRDIAKFCKEGVKSADIEKLIHIIWFCIDGTTKRIDQEVLGYIKSVTNDWKNVPVIVVFTKSYSSMEVEENIQMAKDAFAKYNNSHRSRPINLKGIIPVVAKTYPINDTIAVTPTGLDQLIGKTVELIPEARTIGNDAIKSIDLKLKGAMANAAVAAATMSATVVGAIPIPVPDATILVPIQTAMMNGLAKIYKLQDQSVTNDIIDTMIKVGATTMAGKALINAIKAIPGLQIAGAVLNAAVAGTITLAAGETSNVLFRKVYAGEIEPSSINWEKEITLLFKKYLPGIIEALGNLLENNDGQITVIKLGEVFSKLISTFLKSSKK